MKSEYALVIDLEFNQPYQKGPEYLKQEVIEIGAVLLQNKKPISYFHCYVKPRTFPITKRITKLTGIKNEDVVHAAYFSQAMNNLKHWINMHIKQNGYQVYAWGITDFQQLEYEGKQKHCYSKFIQYLVNHSNDLEQIYCNIKHIQHSLSLMKAIKYEHRQYLGRQHNALCDAVNTAIIYNMIA